MGVWIPLYTVHKVDISRYMEYIILNPLYPPYCLSFTKVYWYFLLLQKQKILSRDIKTENRYRRLERLASGGVDSYRPTGGQKAKDR